MSDEYEMVIQFPKHPGVEILRHTFSLNQTARDIVDLASSKNDQVLPSARVYIHSKNAYELVAPDTKIGEIEQHNVYICPEQFHLTISMGKDSILDLVVQNTYILGDILRYFCVFNHLLDPVFYAAKAKDKILDQSLTLVEQDPYAVRIALEPIDLRSKTEILTKYFSGNDNIFNEREYPRIAASAYFALEGAYNSSISEGKLKRKFADILPKRTTKREKCIEKCISYYKELSSRNTNADDVMSDMCKKIMEHRGFMARRYDKVRLIKGVVDGKQSTIPKCTVFLKYSSLEFYTGSNKHIDTIFLNDMYGLENEMNHSVKFLYNKDGKKLLVRITMEKDEQTRELFEIIRDRKKRPSDTTSRSRTSEQESEVSKTPQFAQIFYYYDKVPKAEICYTLSFITKLLVEKYKGDVERFTSSEDESVITLANLSLAARIYILVSDGIGNRFLNSVEELRRRGSDLTSLTKEIEKLNREIREKSQKKTDRKMSEDNLERMKEDLPRKKAALNSAKKVFDGSYRELLDDIATLHNQKSSLNIREPPVALVRFSLMLLFMYYWGEKITFDRNRHRASLHEFGQDSKLKIGIMTLIESTMSDFKEIDAYLKQRNKVFSEKYDEIAKYANSIISYASTNDKGMEPLIYISRRVEDNIKSGKKDLFEKFEGDLVDGLVQDLDGRSITKTTLGDIRGRVKTCDRELQKLEENVVSLKKSNEYLKHVYDNMKSILGMLQEEHRDAPAIAFNDVKQQVIVNFVTNGSNLASLQGCVKRLKEAIYDIKKSLDPSDSLRKKLDSHPENEIVLILRKIIDYLEKNGPLYRGSEKDKSLSEFISKMQHSKSEDLESLAKAIVKDLPGEFAELIDKCDPTKGKYNDLDDHLDIKELTSRVRQSTEEAHRSAIKMRKSVRDVERKSSRLYQILSAKLWRVMNIFLQFSRDELPGSEGQATFNKCRGCFKLLIEEAAIDMKRDRDYHDTFIRDFISKLNLVIRSPRSPKALAELGEFLKDNQMKAGFYDTAESIFQFNEFLLKQETNKAGQRMIDEVKSEVESRKRFLLIASIKSRIDEILLAASVEIRANQTPGETCVDLRQDFFYFMIKFRDNISAIFTHVFYSRSKDTEAIISLLTAVEALEKLLVLINITDISAPYFARSVCAIVLYSMEGIVAIARRLGGKANQYATGVTLAVREFLFHIRRKIAESEKEALLKNGIGIDDMMAVIMRERAMRNKIQDFQQTVRRRLWDPDYYDFDEIRQR